MAIWNGSLFSGRPHKGNLDLAFEDPFKILLVMADKVVLRFVDENDFEKQGKWYYADVSLKSQSINNFCNALSVPLCFLIFS